MIQSGDLVFQAQMRLNGLENRVLRADSDIGPSLSNGRNPV
jgi:hypothetical protein